MISKEEVLHIAKLARLELTEEEVEKMQKDLTEILDYFNLLKKVPKTEIKTSKSKNQNLRRDEIAERNGGVAEKLISSAPDKKDSYIKVKAIL